MHEKHFFMLDQNIDDIIIHLDYRLGLIWRSLLMHHVFKFGQSKLQSQESYSNTDSIAEI